MVEGSSPSEPIYPKLQGFVAQLAERTSHKRVVACSIHAKATFDCGFRIVECELFLGLNSQFAFLNSQFFRGRLTERTSGFESEDKGLTPFPEAKLSAPFV